jgi:transposase-like protein
MRKKYPSELKRKARKLVRLGVPKCEVSKMLNINSNTLYIWTKDMVRRKGRFGIRGKSLEFLKLLINRGYVLGKEVSPLVSCMRNMRRHLPIKKVDTGNSVVWFLVGREREAMEAVLESMNKRAIGYPELGRIRKAFGIKNIKRKIRLY